MRCFNHNDKEAIAICINCGKAFCGSCCIQSPTGRIVCSMECQSSIQKTEQTLEIIRKRTSLTGKVSGIFIILAGIVFGFFGLFHLLFRPQFFLPLSLLCLILCVIFIVIGVWYLKGDKKLIA